jgi:hypothetical protein
MPSCFTTRRISALISGHLPFERVQKSEQIPTLLSYQVGGSPCPNWDESCHLRNRNLRLAQVRETSVMHVGSR